ncbi:MerR family transcriptional regulator [Kocuria sp. WRN011]|uniref:MerR family transcriptional regulator n=2 Tax=Kocuria TaxID=57493 RepID=A0ABV3V8A5_9MICC|nr:MULTISPECIES: MerR family transcriptional regulator [Kocuria]MCT1803551.1 MerR family transcriptional regulator [Kocuria carniphila]PBB08964.1 MerR family transcriptional regulator [Kocuria sp. WRN011]PZP27249.1 MAG: MerR family transcriptional regulator [Kocuria rhizophila]
MTYTIGETAELLGVPASTMRYYDKEGLLPELSRGAGGRRAFEDKDLEALKVIDCLKQSGLHISEIRQFMQWYQQGDETLKQRQELFQNCRTSVLEQMEQLQRTLEIVEYKCWYYEAATSLGSEQAVIDLPEDQIPARIRGYRDRLEV